MPEIVPIHQFCTLRRVRWLAALLCGLALSCAFAPLQWWWLAWLAFIPLLALPTPRNGWERLGIGLLFGYSHFATCLHWLNTVGFGAGWLLAAYCALYPAVWYYLYCTILWKLKPRESLLQEQSEAELSAAHRSGAALWHLARARTGLAVAALTAATWTALEWVRSWLFTGFPWNQLGISQFGSPFPFITRELYGLSWIMLFSSALLVLAGARVILRKSFKMLALAILWLAALFLFSGRFFINTERAFAMPGEKILRVLAIQGDVPECRAWNEQIFDLAWNRYADLTRQGLQACSENPPDLILWPEGALPAHLTYPPFALRLKKLLQEVHTPILLGALDYRISPGMKPEEAPVFNTAFLLDENSPILTSPYGDRGEYYDKIHRVPFGEYVPFGKYFPWLVDAIGMGRDLTPGQNYKLFEVKGVKIGVNICFEDAFPEISRRFAQDGAELLVTITNDCWYLKSAGARQHRNHAVFRAIDTGLPLLRGGNNSDTCLITPAGLVREEILGPDGSSFAPGWHLYEIPLHGRSYLTRGNIFAHLCAIVTLLALAWIYCQNLKFHAKMLKSTKEGN